MSPAAAWGLEESEKDVLCRMADCVEPSLSAQARRVISAMRLTHAASALHPRRRQAARASIRTFPEAYSRQNFVLALECGPCE